MQGDDHIYTCLGVRLEIKVESLSNSMVFVFGGYWVFTCETIDKDMMSTTTGP